MMNHSSVRYAPWLSRADTASETFQRNYKQMTHLCDELAMRLEQSRNEGRASDVARHLKRGQTSTRHRIAELLDDDSPFFELFSFAGWTDRKKTPRTGVCGVGLVQGRQVLILADVPTQRGGAKNESSVQAGLRALHISIENRMPLINLIQTAGADLTQQDRVFHRGGETFKLLAQRAAMKLPTISIVFGSSTAGGAYHPGMSDYVIMVKRHAKVYLGGPPLVKMATGEIVGHEELGGAAMHSTVSGVSDYLAESGAEAMRIARDIVSTFPATIFASPTVVPSAEPVLTTHLVAESNETDDDDRDVLESGGGGASASEPPLYPSWQLLGIVAPDVKTPFDIHEVMARIVDGSRLSLFKSNFGKTLVCAWATISGFPVALIGNNGVLFPDSSQKGAQFIALSNQKNTPIIFLHNITGFMVGRQSERLGLIKYGALMVNAVSNSTVPHISIVCGASFGAGNYAMCGRSYGPRFMFSYPNAKCSVMGAEQLTGVMDTVASERIAKFKASFPDGIPPDDESKGMLEAMTQQAATQRDGYRAMIEKQMDAYHTSSLLLDDGIVHPCDTRIVLSMTLSIIYAAGPIVGSPFGGVSRL